MSAIFLEAVIIGAIAYGTTVASDSSVSGIIRTRFADKGACQATTT